MSERRSYPRIVVWAALMAAVLSERLLEATDRFLAGQRYSKAVIATFYLFCMLFFVYGIARLVIG